MKQTLILYTATLLCLGVLDGLWLGVIAKDFYRNRLGEMMEVHAIPAILFYLIYPAGIVFFASQHGENWKSVALTGALFGFFAYATYDLTNLATLRGWPLSLSLVDIAWGSLISGISAAAGFLAYGAFSKNI